MASLTHAYVIRDFNLEDMPKLLSIYFIVYIQHYEYAYKLGEETGSKYFILDSTGKVYAQIHGYLDMNDQLRLLDIEAQLDSNDELKNSLSLLPKNSIVKVGEFELHKIIIHENCIFKYNLRGIPTLYKSYVSDDQTKYLETIKL
jgi:hypothetical protein